MESSKQKWSHWAFRASVTLFGISVCLIAGFCFLDYRDEREAFAIGETYDSIGSDYLPFVGIAIVFAFAGTAAAAIGLLFARAAKSRHQDAA